MPENSTTQFRMAAIKQLILSSILLSVQAIVFYISAGETSDSRPWFYFGTAFVHFSVSVAVQFKLSPQLLVRRLKRKRVGSKLWDEIVMRMSNLMVMIAIPAVAGLDTGRFHWSNLGFHFAAVGSVFVVVSTILLNWAMSVNPHFEPTVRIQENHKVIAEGPYNIVRHPGYLGGLFFTLSIPLMIGSAVALVPAAIYVLLMMIRTWLEDRTLQDELEGYSEYSSRVRFKLFPGIW